MARIVFGALAALVFCAGGLWADEVNGKVKNVDPDKNTITLTVEGKDRTYTVAKDAQVVSLVNPKKGLQDVAGGLKGVKEGSTVVLLRETKGTKDVVTQVKVVELVEKKKKKNK